MASPALSITAATISFGQRVSETNAAVDLIFGYTGKLFDEATGLQNNLNRWYDPRLGKFVSQDPIGFLGDDENLYGYVGNNAANATDPSGNIVIFVHGINTENDEEANAITVALNQYCDDNGIPRQEVIHFRYGYSVHYTLGMILGQLETRELDETCAI
ncbi:MAG: RHS repeat-associated core domain-containing protein [Pirellulaceae bacterium]